jgi:hypothetical protein
MRNLPDRLVLHSEQNNKRDGEMKKYMIAGLNALIALGNAHATVVDIDLSGNNATRGPTANLMPE